MMTVMQELRFLQNLLVNYVRGSNITIVHDKLIELFWKLKKEHELSFLTEERLRTAFFTFLLRDQNEFRLSWISIRDHKNNRSGVFTIDSDTGDLQIAGSDEMVNTLIWRLPCFFVRYYDVGEFLSGPLPALATDWDLDTCKDYTILIHPYYPGQTESPTWKGKPDLWTDLWTDLWNDEDEGRNPTVAKKK